MRRRKRSHYRARSRSRSGGGGFLRRGFVSNQMLKTTGKAAAGVVAGITAVTLANNYIFTKVKPQLAETWWPVASKIAVGLLGALLLKRKPQLAVPFGAGAVANGVLHAYSKYKADHTMGPPAPPTVTGFIHANPAGYLEDQTMQGFSDVDPVALNGFIDVG